MDEVEVLTCWKKGGHFVDEAGILSWCGVVFHWAARACFLNGWYNIHVHRRDRIVTEN